MKKWIIKQQDPAEVRRLAAETGVSTFAAKLLLNRGLADRESADIFFNSEEISDPFEIADMDKAVSAINDALDNGDKITVYGDYDCDGITATVILFSYLEAMGAEVDWYIPSRDEGYGLNKKAIDFLAENGTQLVITVDNGISAIEEANYLKDRGIGLIITDHHQVPDTLPDAIAVIDPHRPDDFCKCKELAGCGVALKLVMALENDIESVMENWGDFAAIGTVGDLVPLTGENRIIVRQGLANLNYSENGGLIELLRHCGIHEDDDIPSMTAAFAICPRINAAGRFAHPKEAAELFLCDNPIMYSKMAENLSMLNLQRQEEEKAILAQISSQIKEDPLIVKSRVLVVSGKGWRHGVIGIVASKLMNKFGKPVLVITEEGETARGSARSVEGFSLFEMLTELSDCLLKFGGHTKAAGFTLETERIQEFTEAVKDYARRTKPLMPRDAVTAEMSLSAEELTVENIESLEYFQPFGEGNPSPVFHIANAEIKSLKSLKEGKYVAFNIALGGREFKVVNFSSGYDSFGYREGERVDLLVTAEINEYNGSRSVNLKLADICRVGFNRDRFFAAEDAYERLCCGEPVDSVPAKRVIPDRETQKTVYDIVRGNPCLSSCADIAYSKGINYCMFRVALDIFESVGLMEINQYDNTVLLKKAEGKADLEHCPFVEKLKKALGA